MPGVWGDAGLTWPASGMGQEFKRMRHHVGVSRAEIADAIPGWNYSDVMDVEVGNRALERWQALLMARMLVESSIRRQLNSLRSKLVDDEFLDRSEEYSPNHAARSVKFRLQKAGLSAG